MRFFLLTTLWRASTLAAMRTGLPSIIHRFAPLLLRSSIANGDITRPVLALVAGIFFAAVLAAQAQESVEPDVLPSLAEPPAAPAEAPPSVSTESSASTE